MRTANAINMTYAAVVERRCPGQSNARLPEIVHEDGKQRFLDLRPLIDELRSANPAEFVAKSKEERERIAVLWMNGFYTADPPGIRQPLRWGPIDGDIHIINPSERTRVFQVSMTFQPVSLGVFRIGMSGMVNDDFTLHGIATNSERIVKSYRMEVRSGRNILHITCIPPSKYYFPEDNRTLCYQIAEMKIEEVK